jgi:carboxyl-terminal processing protease
MKIKRVLIVIVLLLGISCNLISRATGSPSPFSPQIGPTVSSPATDTSTALSPTTTSPYIPPECVGVPVATLPAATAQALPTPSAGINPPLSKTEQLQLLDQIAAPIPEFYMYPDLNGLDWNATVAKYRAKVEAGLDTESFYTEIKKMIFELGDDHSQYESPADVAAASAELAGHNEFVGIGVQVLPLIDKGVITVLLVFPGSAAEHAGLKPHDALLTADGQPLIQNGEALTRLVRGPACSATVLTVRSPGGSTREVTLMRYSVNSYLPIDARLVTTRDGSRIGYIYLPTFFDETIPGQVRQALEQFGQLDGLILDNRMNTGGSSNVVEPILGFFTDGVLGHFVSRTDERPVEVKADPVANSQTVPMVVLVGEGSVSFGEIFSGILQDTGRAKLVGQTTLGNVEILGSHNFNDGSRLWLAQERFVPLRSQADWEKTGLIPDVQAYADWDTFTFDNDPGVAAAVKLLGHQ